MTIHWQSFLLGAPFWGSLGIAVFTALLAASRRGADGGGKQEGADRMKPPTHHAPEPSLSVLSRSFGARASVRVPRGNVGRAQSARSAGIAPAP